MSHVTKKLGVTICSSLLIFATSCGGDLPVNPSLSPVPQTREEQVARQEQKLEEWAAKLGNSSAGNIILVDLDQETSYCRANGLQKLERMDPSLAPVQESASYRATNLDPTTAFVRVPTILGTEEKPYSRIAANLKIAPRDFTETRDSNNPNIVISRLPVGLPQFDWIGPGEAAYAFLGAHTVSSAEGPGTTLDIGLTTINKFGFQPGKWIGFVNTPLPDGTADFHHLPMFPSDGIESGTQVHMELQIVDEPTEAVLFITSPDNTTTYILAGRNIPRLRSDGIDQSMRYVTSILSSNPVDAKMKDTKWTDVEVGHSNLHGFTGSELGPPVHSDLIEDTLEYQYWQATPVLFVPAELSVRPHRHTIDLALGRSVTFVIDDTATMEDDLEALKQSVIQFANSGEAENVRYWSLIRFKDFSNFVLMNLEDKSEFVRRVSSITAFGGGDCPEESLQAVLDAATVMRATSIRVRLSHHRGEVALALDVGVHELVPQERFQSFPLRFSSG